MDVKRANEILESVKMDISDELTEGWDGYPLDMSKQDIIDELLDTKRMGVGSKLIASKMVGNELWSVWYYPPEKRNAIFLDLFSKRRNGFMVKGMSELEGPYYYKCPKKFLDLAPVANQEWRDRIIGAEATKKRRQTNKQQKIVNRDSLISGVPIFRHVVLMFFRSRDDAKDASLKINDYLKKTKSSYSTKPEENNLWRVEVEGLSLEGVKILIKKLGINPVA
jgi:hypothetical protein